jgi:squalene synthase HpnC
VVIDRAYATCARLAGQHYENFPVASRLLPKDARPHIAAIYAFARMADDLADEGDVTAAARISALEMWQWRLHEAIAGRVEQDESDAAHVFLALAETIKRFGLEVQLFEDLLSAFCQDVLVKRYDTWGDLLDYCRRSASPIGRLVLRVCGYRNDALDRQSDAICTALQLTNFWQDLAIDWAKGRVYVPREVMQATGATEQDLAEGTWSTAWEDAMRHAVARSRQLFAEGRPLVDAVGGRLRYELRATWLGGSRILDKLEAHRFDSLHHRPKLGWADAIAIGVGVIRWRDTSKTSEVRFGRTE